MGRPRSFDWDEAARLHAGGMSYGEIARHFGKSYHGIRYAIDAEFRRRIQGYAADWQRGGSCPDCGTQTTRHSRDGNARCRACAGKWRQTVRGDEAWCCGCREWLPKTEFQRSSKSARGLRNECRSCGTARRRAYREAHPEVAAAAYERQNARRRERSAALR